MTLTVLWWASALEGVGIVAALLALVTIRWRINQHRREIDAAFVALEPVMQRWLVTGASLEPVIEVLRRIPPHAALRAIARFTALHVPHERHELLAAALRQEQWVATLLRQSTSRFWWKRFDAARLLCVAGTAADVPMLEALLDDPHPAVRLVSIDAAAQLHDRPLVERELESIPRRQDPVQAYHFAALARHPVRVAEALEPRLHADTPERQLIPWIDAASALANPRTLERVRALATHQSSEVRLHVARALRRLADPDTPPVLRALLRDQDWRVRAQAARAAGALRCAGLSEELAIAVSDPAWWVRYRSALALAQIGGPGRRALLECVDGDDRLAQDMARLVAGLSPAAVVEMSEV